MATADSTVTVIGDSVKIRGNLRGEEDLHVLGRVEGSIDLDRTLVVAESGIVKAEVKVRNAVISGVVVGNIHASESVEITREGRMVGDIESPRVIIVDGASFRGNVDMGEMGPTGRQPEERRPAVAPSRIESRPSRPAPSAPPARVASRPEPVRAEPVRPEPVRPEPARAEPARAEPVVETSDDEDDVEETQVDMKAPSDKTTVVVDKPADKSAPPKRPIFLDAPKAKGLPKKSKSRVVVKRR